MLHLAFLACPALVSPCLAAAAESRIALGATALEAATDEALFAPFGRRVAAEVERLLGEPGAIDDPATLRLLLAMRVHLAHHFRDDARAVATAAWIRSLQPDGADKAFAGLTTFAAVEARQHHPGVEAGDPRHRAAFRVAFARRLSGLPRTTEIAAMLRRQREKIAGLTRDGLLAEARQIVVTDGHCTLAAADQLVRVRHRLTNILPVREETLAALDEAIAARERAK